MSNLGIYNFGEGDNPVAVRVITGPDSEPRWVAADVCRAIEITNTAQAINRLDEDERTICTVYTDAGDKQMLVITESGLYSLILTSRAERSKAFKKWVTSEVLPRIRKTGRYDASAVPADIRDRIESDHVTQQLRQLMEVRKDFIIIQARQEHMAREIAEATATANAAIVTAQSVEATVTGRTGFKTVLGYSIAKGHQIEKKRLAVVGRRVAIEAKKRGIEGLLVEDERYDKVRSWPIDFLESVDDMFKAESCQPTIRIA